MSPADKSLDSRRYRRVSFKRPLKMMSKGGVGFAGHLAQDISEGGVRVYSADFLSVGTVVALQVQVVDKSVIIDLQARVVWVRYNPMSENYQLGLEFLDDHFRVSDAIAWFIRSL